MKKCTGTIYKINGKTFCVGEKNKKKSKKSNSNKSKKNLRVKLKNTKKKY
jgi:hypothetical protein